MNKKALQLTCRFALPPNSLGYCGKDSAPEKFKRCITSNECTSIEEEIGKFIVLNPYLKTIAQITNLPAFSYPVTESYWIGNDQLKKSSPEHYLLLLDYFLEQGVPKVFVEKLKKKQPKVFIPHHLFHVLHVGVGQASGAVPFNLESINNCMIRWGKVSKIQNKTLTIDLNSLKVSRNKYILHTKTESHPYSADFLPNLKIGSTVAVHWKQTVKTLTLEEEKKLIYWTNKVLKSICPPTTNTN